MSKLRDLALVLIAGGFVGGQLMANMQLRLAYEAMTLAGGNANPTDLAAASARSFNYTVAGDAIAMLGVVLLLVSVTVRGPRMKAQKT